MTIASYANVLTSIRDWLARPTDTVTLPDERLADLVSFAETEIWDRLRVRDMLATTTLSTTAQSITAPTDLLEVSHIYLTGQPAYTLNFMAPPQFWTSFAANIAGRPNSYTLEGGNLLFGPTPDATYTVSFTYFQRPAALASATNAVFTARPNLWVYGALSHAAPLIGNDARIPVWSGLFERGLQAAQAASDRASYSGAPLMMRPG